MENNNGNNGVPLQSYTSFMGFFFFLLFFSDKCGDVILTLEPDWFLLLELISS